jgi:hypothetical protein
VSTLKTVLRSPPCLRISIDKGKRFAPPRLRERISYFLAEDTATHQSLHDMMKRCYKTRSEIVHGRCDQWDEIEDRMYETESIVRTVVRSIADRPRMLEAFLSPKRDDFLGAMVQAKSFSPPAPNATSQP